MILNLSNTLAQVGDWIAVHFAELGGAISIPVVVWFLAKLVLSFVKNKQAIKSAVLQSVNTLNNGINVLKGEISAFKEEIKTQISDLESNFESKIDGKFEDLRERRKEIYNNIMAGVDKLETKTNEVIEKAEEKVEEIKEVVEQVEKIPEIIENNKTELSVDDILR